MSDQYFEISPDHVEYKGKRFFRWRKNHSEILHVYMGGGEPGRGRHNMLGVYMISAPTFFSNYLAMNYVVPCSKAKFVKAYKKVLTIILP